MTHDDVHGNEESNGAEGITKPVPASEIKDAPINGPHEKDASKRTEDSGDNKQRGPGNFRRRLTINEWLTFLVGAGSLLVSYLTYRNAADTSDLKNAVSNLTSLATEAHQQTLAMQRQAQSMQGQLDQMAFAQRPWLVADNLTITDIQVYPAGAGVVASVNYELKNVGHSPAVAITINTALIFEGMDNFSDDNAKSRCARRPTEIEKALPGYSKVVLPGQTVPIDEFMGAATLFEHGIEGIKGPIISVGLVLAGCVTYKMLDNDTVHHTGFAFKARDYSNFFGTVSIDLGRKGPVKTGKFGMMPAASGNFAD